MPPRDVSEMPPPTSPTPAGGTSARQRRGPRPAPGVLPQDRRALRTRLQALQTRFRAPAQVTVCTVSGDQLAQVTLLGGETVRQLQRCAHAHDASPCQLLVQGSSVPLELDLPLVLAGIEDGAEVVLVHLQELWAATASLDGTLRLSRPGLPWVEERVFRPQGESSATGDLAATDDGVTAVTFSPCGRQVLVAASDYARLWCVETGTRLLSLTGHTGGLTSVAFSPCGGRAATGSKDRTARLWSLHGAEAEAACEVVLEGHEGAVWSAVFAPDGASVLTAARDKTARCWDAGTGALLREFRGHEAPLWRAAFAPDGSLIATASSDRTVRLWEAETGAHRATLAGHENTVTYVSFAPNGLAVLTASRDGKIRLWDPVTGTLTSTLWEEAPGGLQLWSAAWAPDGSAILTGCSSGFTQVWRPNERGEWALAGTQAAHGAAVVGVDLCLR